MNAKISVIIPTAERRDLLRECLESLRRQTFPDFRTTIVSDGAGEWAAELAREFDASLVRLPQQRGFAAAINAGVKSSSGASASQYLLLLNDDVVLSPDWLRLTSALLDAQPEVAFCCGKIYAPDGVTLDNAGDAVSLGGAAWRLGHGRKDCDEFNQTRPVLACSGTASLLRRSVFEELGGFDEDFISYLEDIDFSLRAARRGYRGMYVPQATSVHRGGATSGGPSSPAVFRLMTQNQLLILWKDYPWQLWLRLGLHMGWTKWLWAGMAISKGRFGAYLAGVAGCLRRMPRAFAKRRAWSRDERCEFLDRLRESDAQIYRDITAREPAARDMFWKLYYLFFPPPR